MEESMEGAAETVREVVAMGADSVQATEAVAKVRAVVAWAEAPTGKVVQVKQREEVDKDKEWLEGAGKEEGEQVLAAVVMVMEVVVMATAVVVLATVAVASEAEVKVAVQREIGTPRWQLFSSSTRSLTQVAQLHRSHKANQQGKARILRSPVAVPPISRCPICRPQLSSRWCIPHLTQEQTVRRPRY